MIANRCPLLQAVSSAYDCHSSGNAYSCRAAFEYAKAWADAVASAHAEAFSLVINECHCRGELQQTIATDYGSATVFKQLVADVVAEARAQVCVEGNANAEASAVVSCQQAVYANVFAKVRLHCLPLIVCTLGSLAQACSRAHHWGQPTYMLEGCNKVLGTLEIRWGRQGGVVAR
jgi:hypothetical protein